MKKQYKQVFLIIVSQMRSRSTPSGILSYNLPNKAMMLFSLSLSLVRSSAPTNSNSTSN